MAASLKNMHRASSAFLGRQPEDSCQLTVSHCVSIIKSCTHKGQLWRRLPKRLLPQNTSSYNKETPEGSLMAPPPFETSASECSKGTLSPLILRLAFSLILGYAHHWQFFLHFPFTIPTHVPHWFICPWTRHTVEIATLQGPKVTDAC